VLGQWPKITARGFGEDAKATDVVVEAEATEFSLPRVPAYVVVEMAR
jgi:hypothetical protein